MVETELEAAVRRALLESVLDEPELQCFGFSITDCPGEVAYSISCPKGDTTVYVCAPCHAQVQAAGRKRLFFGLLYGGIKFSQSCEHRVRVEDCIIRPI